MSTILSQLNSKFRFNSDAVYVRLGGMVLNLPDAYTKVTSDVMAGLSNLQTALYSDLAQTYLSIVVATWILSATALLSFWLGWTLGMQLYRLGVWLTRSASHNRPRPRAVKGDSGYKTKLSEGPPFPKATLDFEEAQAMAPVPEDAVDGFNGRLGSAGDCVHVTGDNAQDGAVSAASLESALVNEAASLVQCPPTMIASVHVTVKGTPDNEPSAFATPVKSAKGDAAPPIGSPKDLVGLFTPPTTPAKPLVEGQDMHLCAEEAAVNIVLGTVDGCPATPTQGSMRERRRGKQAPNKKQVKSDANLDGVQVEVGQNEQSVAQD